MDTWHNIANELPDSEKPVIIFDGHSLYEIAHSIRKISKGYYWFTMRGDIRFIDMPYWCYIPEFPKNIRGQNKL